MLELGPTLYHSLQKMFALHFVPRTTSWVTSIKRQPVAKPRHGGGPRCAAGKLRTLNGKVGHLHISILRICSKYQCLILQKTLAGILASRAEVVVIMRLHVHQVVSWELHKHGRTAHYMIAFSGWSLASKAWWLTLPWCQWLQQYWRTRIMGQWFVPWLVNPASGWWYPVWHSCQISTNKHEQTLLCDDQSPAV